jgi:hypothetical protein
MSLIIKKNTTFKIPRTGSGAPSGIPVATSNIIVNGGNAGSPNLTLSRTDYSISTCNYGGDAYTFNAKWEGYMPTVGDWYMFNGADGHVALGIATRKYSTGSGFIFFDNCSSVVTQAVSPTWVLFIYDADEYGNRGRTLATNPSQDFNNVPTTGWVIHDYLTSLTITAA